MQKYPNANVWLPSEYQRHQGLGTMTGRPKTSGLRQFVHSTQQETEEGQNTRAQTSAPDVEGSRAQPGMVHVDHPQGGTEGS